MRDNIIFMLIVFLFVLTIFIFFPNQKNKKFRLDKNDIILKVEKNDNYAAIISKNNNQEISNSGSNNKAGAPSEETNIPKFKISNVRMLDTNQDNKNTFIYNENIFLHFDYELPEGFFTFRIVTIPDVDIELKDDILRTKKGNTEKQPIVFNVINTEELEDIIIDEINIQIFKTDDYENPVFNYIHPSNITIKNLKINLIREEDYTSPLILGNA